MLVVDFIFLCSSINTLLTTTMFSLKFSILLVAQMTMLSNRSFLSFQCHSFDFLLRVCLCMNQWLNACVAVERTITIMQETRFDKKKSKRAARWIILLLLLIIVGTSIHDPIYRRLIDERNSDDDEIKRIWCIITYPSPVLRRYNSFMNTFHFLIPFFLNICSSIILIVMKSRQQSRMNKKKSYKEILRHETQAHKHLLIAPIVLVILALPRLILTVVSRCMESVDDAWLFLIAYFISFIPSIVTFIVFILPSKFYKKEFRKTLAQYRTTIQRRLKRNN